MSMTGDEGASPPVTPEEAAKAVLAPPTPAAELHAGRTGPLLPMIIGAALFMQTLDSTAIANALPTMARSLGQNPVTLNLAITAYLLSTAVFLPLSGWLADRLGARLVFQCAMVGFALSSLLCGLSSNLAEIVGARVLQGMAGAAMVPVGRLVLLRSVPKSELVRAMSFLTMPALLGPILGPPIGGFVVTFLSWRWIFFVNLPISLIGVLLTALFMPTVKEVERKRLDVVGFVLSGLALAGLVFGFENVGRNLLPGWMVAALLVDGVACAVLYWRHYRGTEHPILDLGLLRIETFRVAVVGGLFSRLVIGASPFLLALLLQLGFGLTAFQAGLLTFASAAGALMMKATAGPILARFGFKRALILNTLATAAIFAAYALFRATTPHWIIIAVLLVGGFFRSLQFTALQALAYADVPQASMSGATSFSSVFQQLSQSLGVGAAAICIHLALFWRRTPTLTAGDITPAFVVIALLSLLNLALLVPMPASAGDEVSRRGSRRGAAAA
jgi:EmrB/QacA subfamily drug resistance transporter